LKILVCTDGSEKSQKALEKASLIAEGCNVNEVAIIHVYEATTFHAEVYSKEAMERHEQLQKERKKEGEKILQNALNFYEDKGIRARTILKEGHPAETIVEVGCNEGFDFIVVGSRGLGGLKKTILGSVSNAVVQQAEKCSVVVVR